MNHLSRPTMPDEAHATSEAKIVRLHGRMSGMQPPKTECHCNICNSAELIKTRPSLHEPAKQNTFTNILKNI